MTTEKMLGYKIKQQTWDTAGQERFRTITTSYFRGAMAVYVLYDVTDRNSFDRIDSWMKQIEMHGNVGVTIVLIGNKCDCVEHRCVSFEEGYNLAKIFGIPFFETSAKSDINCSYVFQVTTSLLLVRLIAKGNDAEQATLCGNNTQSIRRVQQTQKKLSWYERYCSIM
jgi:small GTP-binding protein